MAVYAMADYRARTNTGFSRIESKKNSKSGRFLMIPIHMVVEDISNVVILFQFLFRMVK